MIQEDDIGIEHPICYFTKRARESTVLVKKNYRIYLAKCCGIYYLSSKNCCSNYSNVTITHCSQTMFMTHMQQLFSKVQCLIK